MRPDIENALGFCVDSPYWEEALSSAAQQAEIPQWLTADYICNLDEHYHLLGEKRAMVLTALSQVAENPTLCVFAKALYALIDKKVGYRNAFTQLTLPKGDSLGERLVALFPILGHIAPSCAALAQRNVPEDIIYDTLTFLRLSLPKALAQESPRFTESDFGLFPVYLYTSTLWIGRLRFEIHPNANRNVAVFANKAGKLCLLMQDVRLHASGNLLGAIGFTDETGSYDADFVSTDTHYEGYAVNPETCLAEQTRTRLSKKEWDCIFAPGDTLLKVHIPYGGKLTREACEEAYQKARQIYSRCYPEHTFRGFICCTWLLCPALRTFLNENSNIRHFQNDYRIFPSKNTAADVFLYVYEKTVPSADEVDFASLPEENSMQQGVKQLLLSGAYIHQYNGFIPF